MNLETFNDDLKVIASLDREWKRNGIFTQFTWKAWYLKIFFVIGEGSMDTKNTQDRVEIYKTHSKKSWIRSYPPLPRNPAIWPYQKTNEK